MIRIAVLAALFAAPLRVDAAADQRRIVVRTFAPAIEDLAGPAERATEAVLVELTKRSDVKAIGEAELALLWTHADELHSLSPAACEKERECLAALTDATDADLVLNGQVGRFGEQLVATLSLSDAKKVAVIGGASCLADDDAELATCLCAEVVRLLGKGEGRAPFRLTRRAKVLVLDLDDYDVREGIAASLTQLVSVELKAMGELEVLGWAEVKALLDYSIERAAICDEDLTKCFAEIGGALGVDFLVQGAVGSLDGTYVLHLKLLDVQRASVANRIVESYRGPESHLSHAARFAVRQLFGRQPEGEGALELVNVEEVDSLVTVDDANEPQPFEARVAIEPLASGKHSVTVHAEDYYPFHAEAYVVPQGTNRLDVELEPLPTPWYGSWWFWTSVGAVVAAGGVTTYLVLDEPKGSTLDISLRPQ